MRIPTPLKYPGSKTWLVRKMLLSVPTDISEFVSPFFGSGIIELNIAQRGVRVHGYDLCPHLTNFWQQWFKDAEQVADTAKQLLLTASEEELRHIKWNFTNTGLKGASEYYAVNRISYTGFTLNHSHVKAYKTVRSKLIYAERKNTLVFPHTAKRDLKKYQRLPITVNKADFSESINKHPDALIYCDPPYFGKEKTLYNLDNFNHERLRNDLDDKPYWITSYQDVLEVRDLYKGFKIITLKMKSHFYKDGKHQKRQEILIFSKDLAEKLQL